ncbi:MAG: sulfatase-like hydrolase/transferase, partial [Eubacteriales bacterium]|nr:sulfatase-like hydrolase/transferase [Eubacteriales bacterium]
RNKSLPLALGQAFKNAGYTTRAYHNFNGDYYGRLESHPNLGYDYKGLGFGLELQRQMPTSDLEMAQASIDACLNDEHFHLYYLTMSGHMLYDFKHNAMAKKHRDRIPKTFSGTEAAASYLASQVELDEMLKYLIERLNAAGRLDDTVFCISGDHYPYGLSDKDLLSFLSPEEISDPFARYKSSLILWSSSMKSAIEVNKLLAAVDVLPSLYNLFSIPYDPRFLAGRDFASSEPGRVCFANLSFIEEGIGYFDALSERHSGDRARLHEAVLAHSAEFDLSYRILERDYYRESLQI